MARTFLRQDTQVRNSDAYDDTIAPTEAAFETNPTNIQTDMNNLRSQVYNLLKAQTGGNWWDDLNTPSTLETGTQRGVNDLNTALHAIEKKRVLRPVKLLADIVVPAAVAATEVLTLTGNAANTETVTIDGKAYQFQTVLTDVDGNVLIGATASDSIDNLIAAITLGAGAGTLYANSMTEHSTYTASAGAGDTMDIASKKLGSSQNGAALAETLANGSWGAASTSGGAGDLVILGSGELPTQTTAAVGAVTTLGTVVAYEASFTGDASLTEVVGGNSLSPKNLIKIFDGASGDTLFSNTGKQIWALLQSEDNTDAHTITDTTTTRVRLSFVESNATNDDLIIVDDASDIGGKTINYCYNERVRLEDLNEADFLDSAAIDIPVGAGQTTRDQAYVNQGTTPVELATNATLDLNGAGLEWSIRDLLDAELFKITEGSGGGTSTVLIAAGTDTFDSSAAANDFDNGASFDTGAAGTTINVGVTANQIDSGGALTVTSGGSSDLNLVGANEIFFDDLNQTGSTWAQTAGIKLSDSTAEWDLFETNYGEVSLLNAINQAFSSAASFDKTCANVTSTTVADTDVGGIGGGGTLDAQLHDLSGGAFLTDHDVYLNGQLLRGGADASANNDYYPGTSLANGQLKFEFVVKLNDVLCVISRA